MTDKSENGQPRISNFNKAEILGPHKFSSLPCETTCAPEIKDGHHYNHQVDVWAYGVLLYELSTGK
jgi:serine/threonine protein kinase